jgi:C-terminal processing protease CtpA/Prc
MRIRSRKQRITLYISIPFLFLLFVIGYLEPGSNSTETQGQLQTKEEVKFDERSVSNIKALAKLYGYVRYFHPSDEVSNVNWNKFLVYGVQEVVHTKNAEELESKLEELFTPIAPTLQIYRANQKPKGMDKKEGSKLIAWQHYGLDMSKITQSGFESKRVISDTYEEILLFDNSVAANTVVNKSLNSELKAQIPIVLYTNEKGTIGSTKESLENLEYLNVMIKYVKHDEKTKYLVNSIIAWNVFQHFYPYFDEVNINWETELDKTLSNILIHSKNTTEFENHLRTMLSKLADGQISALDETKKNYVPFNFDWIENELIVTASESSDIQIGDRILKINNLDSKEFVTQFESEISGSDQWKKYQGLKETITSASDESELTLELERNGSMIDPVKVPYNYFELDDFNRSNKEPLYEVEDGIYYINQTLISDYQFNLHLDELSAAKGIIIDLRGNPEEFEVGKYIISHLIDSPVQSPIIQVPKVIYPDREEMTFETNQFTIDPVRPKFPNKIVYLTYNGTLGSSEMFLHIVKDNQLAEIVGQTTAGASGGVNSIRLLDTQNRVYWTGSKVLKNDGSQHHLIGVKPTITVERTIEGVKQGNDEYIEKALEIIKTK